VSVLVTGSNGFLGSSLIARLADRGTEDLRCCVRAGSNRTRLEQLKDERRERQFSMVEGSLGSVETASRALDGVDTVYHLAAAMNGSAADMYLGSVVASKNLLEAAAKQKRRIKFVLVSSFGVYGVAALRRGSVINEQTPLEDHSELRDIYSQTKLRQEQLFHEYCGEHDLPLTVLRPGVIYGPAGGALSARVGIQLPGVFLYLGHGNLLPLSYVDNCAEAIALAGSKTEAEGQVYNVHDDDLPTCREYLARYERSVRPLRKLPVPYPLLWLGSHMVERYHEYSNGQLPAIFTPYKIATTWKGHRFDNGKLKGLGWSQTVPTAEGMQRTFAALAKKERQRSAA
jgi:nucleoside-diphosphate-sugar epimerase